MWRNLEINWSGIGSTYAVQDLASGQTRIGRFGWKAQAATLLSFAGDAYLNEMGITNRLFPTENPPNGNTALLAQYDLVPDPEDVTDPVTARQISIASPTSCACWRRHHSYRCHRMRAPGRTCSRRSAAPLAIVR